MLNESAGPLSHNPENLPPMKTLSTEFGDSETPFLSSQSPPINKKVEK